MIIKKFQGKSEAEAVESAKKELGNNVVIMNVRNVKRKGLFSFILPQLTEVTVALEEEPERVPVPKKEAAPAQMLPEPAVRRELTTLPAPSENAPLQGEEIAGEKDAPRKEGHKEGNALEESWTAFRAFLNSSFKNRMRLKTSLWWRNAKASWSAL